MQQVLFRIPPDYGLPIYGFGIMLLIAISTAAWLAGRRAKRKASLGAIRCMIFAGWSWAD